MVFLLSTSSVLRDFVSCQRPLVFPVNIFTCLTLPFQQKDPGTTDTVKKEEKKSVGGRGVGWWWWMADPELV